MSQGSNDGQAEVDTSGFYTSDGQATPALQYRIDRLSTATGRPREEIFEQAKADPETVLLTEHERKELLQETIQNLKWDGYQVVSQTDYTAEFIRPKKFNIFLAVVLLVLTIGIGLLIYLIWYWRKDDDHASVSIGTLGQVTAIGVSDIIDPAYATTA